MPAKLKDPDAHFWSRVDKSGDCWLWLGARNRDGYGVLNLLGEGLAHRLAWQLANDREPGRGYVIHSCDNPPCVNPAHLRLADQLANMLDAKTRGRLGQRGQPAGEAHSLAKLTEGDVRAIRAATGLYRDIAAVFGVCATQVGRIKRRERWGHI